jgi:putative endonuclease
MYYVYVLRSVKFGRLYKGVTDDVPRRLREHNEGLSASTKHWRPWELVHLEEHGTRAEALRRERYLKSGKGREELREALKLPSRE